MSERLFPDRDVPGAFWVRFGPTSQSWVDPSRPDFLAFEYVQHIAMVLDHTVLDTEPERRLRVVHLGGAGMSLPRWVAWRRPGTAQVVCEPDADLVDEVRRLIPLPRHTSIRIRVVDGRAGLEEMPPDYFDALVLDAFDGPRVPPSLASVEFLAELAARQREWCRTAQADYEQMNCQLLERLQQAEQTLRQPDMSSFRRMEEGLTALEKGLTAPEKAGE